MIVRCLHQVIKGKSAAEGYGNCRKCTCDEKNRQCREYMPVGWRIFRVKMTETEREEAKEEILALFKEKIELDYYDIMISLGLDLEIVVEVCAELEEEKKIETWGPE